MKRYALQHLKAWKENKQRKPLMIYGARQVGKTWLMTEFGKTEFPDFICINLEKNSRMAALFESTLEPEVLLRGMEMETHKKITPETLIILDEIQACPKAITSLKYFCEDFPAHHIVAAGSLLGVALHKGVSFPVGKVESLNMYPLTFCEFLDAIGEEQLCEAINARQFDILKAFGDKLTDHLKTYFYVGGMPEVVSDFVANRDYQKVRVIQNRILNDYKRDFSSHIPDNMRDKVTKLWDSVPQQLAKENKKFVYKDISGTNPRSKEYDPAVEWLKDSGLIYKICRVSKPSLPIEAYRQDNIFKLYVSDIGLLGAKSKMDVRVLLEGAQVFTEFKGAMTEQFVLQELKTNADIDMAYWANENGQAEIDFVVQTGTKIIPLEVKAGINLRAKSLSIYQEKFKPEKSVRTSLADYKQTGDLYDIPLYAIELFDKICGA